MDREGASRYLLEQVKNNNTQRVETMVKSGKLDINVIRYELFIPNLLESTLQENKLAFKLLQCEINSLSSFHFSALMGYYDILVSFLNMNIEVDMTLESGTTALHLACFGGHVATVKLLLNVYKADVNRTDRYGWTALHYASAEGDLDVIKLLVQHGADIHKRDKDGTCAALRAQWQGHTEVVTYFCHIGEEDELLNIAEGEDSLQEEPQYAKINKLNKQQKEKNKTPTKTALEENNNTKSQPDRRGSSPAASTGIMRSHSTTAGGADKAGNMSKSATLPTRFKEARHSRIRRVIQQELESAFSDYANPMSMQEGVGASGDKHDDSGILMAGVGVNTMTKLMREEIQKYRDQILSAQRPLNYGGAAIKEEEGSGDDDDYESLYDTLRDFGEAPGVPSSSGGAVAGGSGVYNTYVPPPLPPRNQDEVDVVEDDDVDRMFKSMSIKGQPTSEALNAAIRKLGQILGGDWKKLARSLPIDPSGTKVEERIKSIEKQHLGNTEKQALQALLDWRLKKGKEAEVDALIIAMRKCGLHSKIEAMESAAYEFTA